MSVLIERGDMRRKRPGRIHKFRAFSYILGLFLILFTALYIFQGTNARTIIVDDDGGRWADHNSIQGAIEFSSVNDTVLIYNGTYSEHLRIDHKLVIAGNGTQDTILMGNDSSPLINITGIGCTISGLFLQATNDGTGIIVQSDNTILRELILRSFDRAIEVESCNSTIIEDCSLEYCDYGVFAWEAMDTSIRNVDIHDCDCGVYIWPRSSVMITNSSIVSWHTCVVVNGPGSQVMISHSRMTNSGYGLLLVDCHDISFSNNLISDCSYGMSIIRSNNISIHNNSFNHSDLHGVHLEESRNVIITENRFLNASLTISGSKKAWTGQDIPENNTFNGYPALMVKDRYDATIEVSMVHLFLINCSNLTIAPDIIGSSILLSTGYCRKINVNRLSFGTSTYGIQVHNSIQVSFESCHFNVSSAGIYGEMNLATRIMNCTFTGSRYGIDLKSHKTHIDNCSFDDLAISVQYVGTKVLLSDSIFTNCSIGISLKDYDGNIRNVTVENCRFIGIGRGIYINNVKSLQVINSTFKDNNQGIFCNRYGSGCIASSVINSTFIGNQYGIYLDKNDLEVMECNFSQNDVGIKVLYGSASISNTEFVRNREGLIIQSSQDLRILDNRIDGNSEGIIVASSSNVEIRNCSMINNTEVNIFATNSFELRITENEFRNVTGESIRLGNNCRWNQVFRNRFFATENGSYGVIDHNRKNNWDHSNEGNFWSKYNGSDVDVDGIGDTGQPIDGYGNATDRYPHISMNMTISNRTIIVDNNWSSSDYSSIQEAIDSAYQGYTIRVNDGLYYENILVEKRIKIVGNGTERTIIMGGIETSTVIINTSHSLIQNLAVTSAGPGADCITIFGSENKIQNVDVFLSTNSSGNTSKKYLSNGIEIQEAQHSIFTTINITNCTTGINSTSGIGNLFHGINIVGSKSVGIRTDESEDEVYINVTVSRTDGYAINFDDSYEISLINCTIKNNDNGAWIRSDRCSINNSIITGNHTYGILIEGINLTITNSSISNSRYGIFVYDRSEGLSLTACNLTKNQYGIHYDYSCGPSLVHACEFEENLIGLYANDRNGRGIIGLEVRNSTFAGNSKGIALNGITKALIYNCNFIENTEGIEISSYEKSPTFHYIQVTNSTFRSNAEGVHIRKTNYTNVTNCRFEDNNEHLTLENTEWASLSNNEFGLRGIKILGTSIEHWQNHDIDSSNTVDGRPILHWVGRHNIDFTGEAAQIFIVNSSYIDVDGKLNHGRGTEVFIRNSSNCTIDNFTANGTYYGLYISNSYNISAECFNSSRNRYGVYVTLSQNVSLINSSCSESLYGLLLNECDITKIIGYDLLNTTIGLYAQFSNQVTIQDSRFKNITTHGIVINYGQQWVIDNCSIINASSGISAYTLSEQALISNNSIELCTVGISLSNCVNVTLIGNLIRNCSQTALAMPETVHTEVMWNNFTDNGGYGISLSEKSHNNTIHHNNFISNSVISSQASDDSKDNFWHNGTAGNFWSDYKGGDTDGDGIGEIPYFLNGRANASDPYPLVDSWKKIRKHHPSWDRSIQLGYTFETSGYRIAGENFTLYVNVSANSTYKNGKDTEISMRIIQNGTILQNDTFRWNIKSGISYLTMETNLSSLEQGNLSLSIIARRHGHSSKFYNSTIHVVQSIHSFSVWADPTMFSIENGTSTIGTLFLKNSGNLPVLCKLSNKLSWVKLDRLSITIKPDNTTHIPFSIATPVNYAENRTMTIIIQWFVEGKLVDKVNLTIGITVRNETFVVDNPIVSPGDKRPGGLGPTLIWTVAILIVLATSAIAFGTEVGRYTLFGAVVPLYSKVKKDKMLNNETRGAIITFIEENPGARYTDIRKALDLPNGTTSHHLSMLERSGFIKSRSNGVYKLFYPFAYMIPDIVLEKNETLIVIQTIKKPGVTQKELSLKLGITRSTVGYHVRQLKRKGVFVDSRKWGCHVSDQYRDLMAKEKTPKNGVRQLKVKEKN